MEVPRKHVECCKERAGRHWESQGGVERRVNMSRGGIALLSEWLPWWHSPFGKPFAEKNWGGTAQGRGGGQTKGRSGSQTFGGWSGGPTPSWSEGWPASDGFSDSRCWARWWMKWIWIFSSIVFWLIFLLLDDSGKVMDDEQNLEFWIVMFWRCCYGFG